MKENTEKAFEAYRLVLKKNKLKENVNYTVDFDIMFFSQTLHISKINFEVFIDNFELSPILLANCINDKESCCVSFASPEFIIDKYDRDNIYTSSNFISPHTYDLSFFKSFTKKINLKI